MTGTFCSELCSSLLLMYYFSSNLVPAQIYSNLMGTIFFCFISYPSQRLLILLFFTILADEIQQMQMGHHLFLPRILRLLVLLDPRILRPRALFYRTECTCRSKFLMYTLKYKHFYLSLIFDYILMFYLYWSCTELTKYESVHKIKYRTCTNALQQAFIYAFFPSAYLQLLIYSYLVIKSGYKGGSRVDEI